MSTFKVVQVTDVLEVTADGDNDADLDAVSGVENIIVKDNL